VSPTREPLYGRSSGRASRKGGSTMHGGGVMRRRQSGRRGQRPLLQDTLRKM